VSAEIVTVPADMLPGLLRPGVDVMCGSLHVFLFEYEDQPGCCLLADEQGVYPDIPVDVLELVISAPTGWNAAVDALARRSWTMQDTDRAEFCFADGAWTLFPPARLQRARPCAPRFQTSPATWREVDADVSPVEALRRVLYIVAGVAVPS